MALTAAVALVISLGLQPSPSALKIVAIAGEDAVNIIQQKTAVAPIVEVRDRNDQPVAGVVVTFAIRRGRASFGGARTLAVTTDASGRAVATGLTPSGTGTLQITASVAFQGQTVEVTIAQSNVMTAAQAAAIAGGTAAGAVGAAAVGGVAGGGGGLNGLTIGLIAGGVGAGALVAVTARSEEGGSPVSGPAPASPTAPINPGTPSPPSPPSPPGPPAPTFTLYDIRFTPFVTTVNQCPQAPQLPTPGPEGTSISFANDGSLSGTLFTGVSTQPAVPVVTIAGRATPADVSATMMCIGGGGPMGSLSGTGTPSRYQGNWTFGSLSGTFSLTPK